MLTRPDQHIALCLDSGEDFEIVVVDDGSPDGTQHVVRRLQKEYGEHLIVRRPCDMLRTSVTHHTHLQSHRGICTVSSPHALTFRAAGSLRTASGGQTVSCMLLHVSLAPLTARTAAVGVATPTLTADESLSHMACVPAATAAPGGEAGAGHGLRARPALCDRRLRGRHGRRPLAPRVPLPTKPSEPGVMV